MQQLISFGITNDNHRDCLLNGLKLIHIATTPVKQEQHEDEDFFDSLNCTAPFIPQPSLSQGSVSSNSGMPLEVLRIQMKKTFSSSSNSSCE